MGGGGVGNTLLKHKEKGSVRAKLCVPTSHKHS